MPLNFLGLGAGKKLTSRLNLLPFNTAQIHFSRLMNFHVVKVEAVELVLALDGVLEQGLAVNTAILESHFKV